MEIKYKLAIIAFSAMLVFCFVCSCSIDNNPIETNPIETNSVESLYKFTEYDYYVKPYPESERYSLSYGRDKSSLRRIDPTSDDTIWQVDFSDYYATCCVEVPDGVVALIKKTHDRSILRVVKYRSDGTLITDAVLTEDEYGFESIIKVFECENGDVYIVSKGRDGGVVSDMKYIFTVLDCNAHVKYREKYELGNYDTFSFFQNKNGVVCIKQVDDTNKFSICFVDEKGMMGEFSQIDTFLPKDSSVSVYDAVGINGNTVISFYEFDGNKIYKEIQQDCLDDNGESLLTDVTAIAKDNIFAALVCFNNLTKESRCLLSVKGKCFGRIITAENGFAYDTLSPKTVRFSPYTSAYSYVGDFTVNRYTFSKAFVLISGPEEKDISVTMWLH